MANIDNMKEKKRESIFLNEHFMGAACVFFAAAGIASLVFLRAEMNSLEIFGSLVKLAAAVSMYFAFRSYKWDVSKGLMGGVLFCLMYQEAYLVLGRLWQEDFNTYLVAGIQGTLYLSAAEMSLFMTIIITINHFFMNYAIQGNPKSVILNRMSIIFKFAMYVLLLAANSRLDFPSVILWKNALQALTDIALLLMIVCLESQFDSFKVLRQELLKEKRERGI